MRTYIIKGTNTNNDIQNINDLFGLTQAENIMNNYKLVISNDEYDKGVYLILFSRLINHSLIDELKTYKYEYILDVSYDEFMEVSASHHKFIVHSLNKETSFEKFKCILMSNYVL